MITFVPRTVSKELLATLPDRSRNILVQRFGLARGNTSQTLEAIGAEYGITRERVRQIENHGLAALRNSGAYTEYDEAFENLRGAIRALGELVGEHSIASELSPSKEDQRHIIFLLTVGQPFMYEKEDAHFTSRWHVNEQLAASVHRALMGIADDLSHDDLLSEEELLARFEARLAQEGVTRSTPEILSRWITLAKRIARNPLGEWGRADSSHVRVKSMRDYAYLALKRHGSPMHFAEVAAAIESLFHRSAHPATCHNELIKDPRFILVGRGMYALGEWGYAPGIVRDVIREILEKEGPLAREEIVERVRRERYVKDATITVNLQDGSFVRLGDGRYSTRS